MSTGARPCPAYGVQMATQLGSAMGVGTGGLQLANMGVEYLMTLPNSRGTRTKPT